MTHETQSLAGYLWRGLMVVNRDHMNGGCDLSTWQAQMGAENPRSTRVDSCDVLTWNLDAPGSTVVQLSREPRGFDLDLSPSDVRALTSASGDAMRSAVLPPFAAAQITPHEVTVTVDGLGFRHIYLAQGRGWAALSTSARALALLSGGGVDLEGVASQSLLGWQLGVRTMFDQVQKMASGATVSVSCGRLARRGVEPAGPAEVPSNPARAAADVLREFVGAYVDDHPDVVLQLTGGLDSRLLLAALPRSRRRGLDVMTLRVPGSEDAAIAGELAARFGMNHHQTDFEGLADLDPVDAFRLCMVAARRVDSAADPVALAAVDFSELSMGTRPRLAGLGGEVARGFYYFGPVSPVPVTRGRVARLARWRMFSNEAAPTEMLRPDFVDWAQESTIGSIHQAFVETGRDWHAASDEFYLGQRMQRWAGVLASATSMERTVVNPMLHPRFLDIVRLVPPRGKKNALFLSKVLVELDPELARVRMDSRPPPLVYASPGAGNRARLAALGAGKVLGKVRQRISKTHRSAQGGTLLAGKVVQHLRDFPSLVSSLDDRIVDQDWLEKMVAGKVEAESSAVALMVNLLAAQTTSA